MSYPKVSLVILNWNGKDITIACLKSVEKIDYPNYQVIVVDNGSTDGSQKEIKAGFPSVHLMENGQNLGFPEGMNVGIRYALDGGADYVFSLNNDTILDRDILTELVKVAESSPAIGIVVPKVYFAQEPNRIQTVGGMIDWKKGRGYHLKIGEIDTGEYESEREVDYLGLPLIKKAVIDKIGLYDSGYFAYWEDVDLCTRAKRAGFKVISVPRAKIWHEGTFTIRKISGFFEYYSTRNRFWFMKRHASGKQFLLFILWFFFFELWFRGGVLLVYHRNIKAFVSFCRGIKDGILKSLGS